jgi:hypothetical protein
MENINLLFVGDIVGKPGLNFVQTWLPGIIQKYKSDIVIANGENVSDGKGITPKEGDLLFNLGIHAVTGGNHTWEKHQSQDYLKNEKRVLRPLNYPSGVHGSGYYIFEVKNKKIVIVSLQGRAFMTPIDCPFRKMDWLLSKIKNESNIIIVDFHAEATAEKNAMGYYLDGKVSAVIGTHTHIQTADDKILKSGTAYITDVGMTGPYESVIGMKITPAINRFLYATPQRYETAENDVHLSAVSIKINCETGRAVEIERILFPDFVKTYNPTENTNGNN